MKPAADSATRKTQSGPGPKHDPQEENFPFTPEEIDRRVTKESPGFYALGYLDEYGQFTVRALGRADEDLREELSVRLMLLMSADLVVEPAEKLRTRYARFTFSYAKTAKEAFIQQCLEYHRLSDELDDKRHPSKEENNIIQEKKGPRWFCPVWQCAWNY